MSKRLIYKLFSIPKIGKYLLSVVTQNGGGTSVQQY